MDDSYKHPVDEKKVRFRPNITSSRGQNIRWIIIITVSSFLISATMSFASSNILKGVSITTAFFVVFTIIFISITADIIGTAVTAADETPFHAMASRKMYGAKKSIKLIRNADKVSNLCNDVIGDICGVISGSAIAYIIVRLIHTQEDISIAELALTGMVASLTVGGKALGKAIAIKNSNQIIYRVSVILQFISGRISFGRSKKRTPKKLKES